MLLGGACAALAIVSSFAFNYSTSLLTPKWTYNDPNQWVDVSPICGDLNTQSPIDIPTEEDLSSQFLKPLDIWWTQDFNIDFCGPEVKMVMSMYTWKVLFPMHSEAPICRRSYLFPNVRWRKKRFYLTQFDYHAPSEHTFNRQHFDMEVHHSHVAEDGEILVIAVMIKVGKENKYMKQFWADFPNTLEGSGEYKDSIPASAVLSWHHLLPYHAFMPTDMSYYYYLGSETTPPCRTNVVWILLAEPVEMSNTQLEFYRQAIDRNPIPYNQLRHDTALKYTGVNSRWDYTLGVNNRPIQNRGARRIYVHRFHFGPLQVISSFIGASSSPMFFLLMLLAALLTCCLFAIIYMAIQGCVCANVSKKRNSKTSPGKNEAFQNPVALQGQPNLTQPQYKPLEYIQHMHIQQGDSHYYAPAGRVSGQFSLHAQ